MRTLALTTSILLAAGFSAGAQAPPAALLQDIANAVGFGEADGGPVAAGRDYKVLLRPEGISFVPTLGDRAPHNLPLDLRFAGAWRGDVLLHQGGPAVAPDVQPASRQVLWTRGPGLTERLVASPAGVELSWELASPPAGEGDLVILLDVLTELPLLQQDPDGLLFADENLGGVRVGRVTGRDAAGREVEGGLAFEPVADGPPRLRLSLPEHFVREARYPLVLDPPITPWFTVWTASDWPFGQPRHDALAALTDANYFMGLCIWVSDHSLNDHDILGRLVTYMPDGLPPVLGDLLLLDTSVLWDDLPEVSTATDGPWALVSWVRLDGIAGYRLRGLLAHLGPSPGDQVIGTASNITGVGVSLARPGVNAGIHQLPGPLNNSGCVVYGTTTSQLRCVPVETEEFAPGNQLIVGAEKVLLSGVPDASPTISRTLTDLSNALVAYQQSSGVYGLILKPDLTVLLGPKLLKAQGFTPVGPPRVDGTYGGEFALVVTEDHPLAGLRVTLTYVDELLSASPHYVVSDFATFPGDVIVAHVPFFNMPVVSLSLPPAPGSTPVSTTTFSGTAQGSILASKQPWGPPDSAPVDTPSLGHDTGVIVAAWVDTASNVMFQFGTPWGPGGTITSQGGPCGGSGILSTNFEPAAVGNWQFQFYVSGASPLATQALLNLGLPAPPAVCGSCTVKPPQLLMAMSMFGATSFIIITPLPDDPALKGLTLEAQGIVKTPGAGGCAGLKDWSFSNRLQFTIQ